MLFQASRAVTASSEMSLFISVSEYAPPCMSLLILACIEALGANSGANQQEKGVGSRPHLSSSGVNLRPGRNPAQKADSEIFNKFGPASGAGGAPCATVT